MDTYTTCSPSLLRANEKMSWNFSFKNNFHHSNVFFLPFLQNQHSSVKIRLLSFQNILLYPFNQFSTAVSLRLPPNYSLLPVSLCLTTSHPLLFQNIHHCFPLSLFSSLHYIPLPSLHHSFLHHHQCFHPPSTQRNLSPAITPLVGGSNSRRGGSF